MAAATCFHGAHSVHGAQSEVGDLLAAQSALEACAKRLEASAQPSLALRRLRGPTRLGCASRA